MRKTVWFQNRAELEESLNLAKYYANHRSQTLTVTHTWCDGHQYCDSVASSEGRPDLRTHENMYLIREMGKKTMEEN